MGIFDFFARKASSHNNSRNDATKRRNTAKSDSGVRIQFCHEGENRNVYVVGADTIPDDEKQYYRPDEYYKNYAYNGLVGEEITPFESRKKYLPKSKNGLYPAEILLLHYCTYSQYPFPRNGFPGFWWYQYGIRDVIGCLGSLEARGFLQRSDVYQSLRKYLNAELQEILSEHGLNTKGKKAVLIQRIIDNINADDLAERVTRFYYSPTELGLDELRQNRAIIEQAGVYLPADDNRPGQDKQKSQKTLHS